VRRWRRAAPLLAIAILLACGPKPPAHEVVRSEGRVLRLAHSVVADGKVHFFTFEHDGKEIDFLVRTDGRGRLHAHLDACFSCYHYHLGFVVVASDLLCIACRYTYPITEEVWDFQGACAPIPIPFDLEGEWLVIERRALERAARFF